MSSIFDSKGRPVSSKLIPYEVGGVRVDSPDTPEMAFQKALATAQQMVGNAAGQMALQRNAAQIVAQAEAQAAASAVSNPFHLEPAALAVFMLMAREIEHRDRVINALAKRLDALDGQDSNETLKKSWKPVEQTDKN